MNRESERRRIEEEYDAEARDLENLITGLGYYVLTYSLPENHPDRDKWYGYERVFNNLANDFLDTKTISREQYFERCEWLLEEMKLEASSLGLSAEEISDENLAKYSKAAHMEFISRFTNTNNTNQA